MKFLLKCFKGMQKIPNNFFYFLSEKKKKKEGSEVAVTQEIRQQRAQNLLSERAPKIQESKRV